MSRLIAFKEVWNNRAKLGDGNRSRELAEFLPAALEIQESPPNPLARWLARVLLILILLFIAWATFGQVNIVASAEGKIIPSSRVKQVQPLEKGVVKKLMVSEGERVKQGQPLIELDTTISSADRSRLESELHSLSMKLAINESFLHMLASDNSAAFPMEPDSIYLDMPVNSTVEERKLYKNLLLQQWLQYQSQHQSLAGGLEKVRAEQLASKEMITKLSLTLPIVEKRAKKLKALNKQSFVSENDFLIAEQERIQISQDLAVERQKLKQLHAAEVEVIEQTKVHKAQTQSNLLAEVTELKRQMSVLEKEYTKAQDVLDKQVLYAPVAGRVQDLMVTTIGGIVTEAQQLMSIVPEEDSLEVEVYLENKDIGFVREGMTSEVKIHTFPFTKYGVIDAEIVNVSDDAVLDEKKGLLYRMQLRLAKNTIPVDGRIVDLQPGMAVTAEVQTGERRIVEFFLAPLLRHGQESLRER